MPPGSALQPSFEASDRLKQLLLFLVQRSIEAPEERISQAEIATAVLGYDASFDPTTDAHVRIEVGRLRKALELGYARCSKAGTMRIDLPKGSYRPVLRQARQATAGVRRTARQRAPVLALADFHSTDARAAELGFLIGEEAQLRCQQAPLVRSGAMQVTRLPAGTEVDCLDAARLQRARLVMCGSVHHLEGCLRVYTTLVDVAAGRVVSRDSHDCRHAQTDVLAFADAVAEQIATDLADPMLGAVPRFLAAADGRSPLDILMRAYDFMATQDVHRVGAAIEGLRWLDGEERLLATSGALLADLLRVAANSRLTPDPASPGECVDLAGAALCRDPKNITARLALGYALLNDGRPDRAAEVATALPAEPGTTSLIADRRLLEVVAAANTQPCSGRAAAGHNALASTTSGFFMDELATAITLLANGDNETAIARLDRSTNQDIYWTQLFKVAALSGLGEAARACDARQRLCALLPNATSILRPTITGFFPSESIRSPLLESLGQAGMRLS